MRKKSLFLLLLWIAVTTLVAQNQNEYLNLIKEQKYSKAEKLAEKALQKNPADISANFGKAALLLQKDYELSNPDSAYRYAMRAKEEFATIKDRTELAALRKEKINRSAINKLISQSYKLSLDRADEMGDLLDYQQFLASYPDADDMYKNRAKNRIANIFYKALRDTNKIKTYSDFIADYPDTEAAAKAQQRLHKLAFEAAELDGTKTAYKNFMDNYPESREYPKAKAMYETSRYIVQPYERKVREYKRFLDANRGKDDFSVEEKQDSLLAIALQTNDIVLLKYCATNFSGYKREEAMLYYHDVFTDDGEKVSLDAFYKNNADPLFKTIRVNDYKLATLGDSLNFNPPQAGKQIIGVQSPEDMQREIKKQSEMYDRYIKLAAPRERAFVALQRMMAHDIADKKWKEALETIQQYKIYFGAGNPKILELEKMFSSTANNSVEIKSVGDGVNTMRGREYHPVISANDSLLYFCAKNRPDSIGGEDIYVSRNKNGVWQQATIISELSKRYSNDAPLSVTADGNRLLTFISGQINYTSKTPRGMWSMPEAFPKIINSEGWQADAMISSDGKALIFVSERAGGYNRVKASPYHGSNQYASDIYVSILNDKGQWTTPINLGYMVNTPYCERTPFLHPDMKTLYFSSDGHGGLGGLDVFKTTRLADSCWNCWSTPINLGKEINTEGNDLGFKISTDGERAYFSKGSKGKEDIYTLNLPSSMRPNQVATLSGKITDSKGKALDVEIIWEDLETGAIIGQARTNPQTGEYFVVLPLGKIYGYYIDHANYFPSSGNADLRHLNEATKKQNDIKLVAMQEMTTQSLAVSLNNLFFNTNESVILPYSISELKRTAAILKSRKLKVEISGHTDNVGDAAKNQTLSENRAQAVRNFLISEGVNAELLTTKGYGATKPIADNNSDAGRAKNRRVELKIVK
ncbi:MAG: OmpA family protein [Prevotellaceae bacterium]|jgi:outer membrane protein OmpA-like peptidoglycan-associated protein|nr:OmpA family protein [Prevotellaceae bacterium]